MTFDPTVTIGAIFIVISQIGSMFFYAARMDKRIDLLSAVVEHLRERIEAQGDTIKEYAKIGERFVRIEGRVDNHDGMITTTQRDVADLRRGKGFIRNGPDGVDREYN